MAICYEKHDGKHDTEAWLQGTAQKLMVVAPGGPAEKDASEQKGLSWRSMYARMA